MTKLFRILGLCALVALTFGSCKKNETKVFKAFSVQLASDSKTHLNFNQTKVLWDKGDQITVVNPSGEYHVFAVDTIYPDASAGFHVYNDLGSFITDNIDQDGNLKAYYPNATQDGTVMQVNLPTHQTFAGYNFTPGLFPMFGSNQGGSFVFSSDAGILAIPFNSTSGTTAYADSLVLTALGADDYLAGTMTYAYNAGNSYGFVGSSHKVTLVGDGSPLEIPGGVGNYLFAAFVLPKGALANGFILDAYYGVNGSGDPVKVFHKAGAADGSCTIVERSIRLMEPTGF